jgi:hypothetical protein
MPLVIILIVFGNPAAPVKSRTRNDFPIPVFARGSSTVFERMLTSTFTTGDEIRYDILP